MHATSAEAGGLSCGVRSGERGPVASQYLAVEVGVYASECFAGEYVQFDADQWSR